MTSLAPEPSAPRENGPLSRITNVRRWVGEQAGDAAGDATRHLCAAAYLDRHFRNKAIEELVEQKFRVPAPMPGTNGDQVLEACLRARRAAVLQGVAVLVVGVIGLVLSVGVVFFAVAALLFLRFVIAISDVLARSAESRPNSVLWRGFARSLRLYNTFMVWGSTALTLLILVIVTLGSTIAGGLALGWAFGWTLATILLWIAIGAAYRYHVRGQLMPQPGQAPADPAGADFPALHEVFRRLRDRVTESETVYGGHAAFVGSGQRERAGEWTFSIELAPRKALDGTSEAHSELTAADMHRLLAQRLASLGGGPLYPEDALHRISVRDRVFRSGLRKQPPQQWLGSLSVSDPSGAAVLDPELVDLVDLASSERLRHYLEVRTELWEKQIVASVFIRIHLQGHLLQMEGLPFVLLPVAEGYRLVDQLLPRDTLVDGTISALRAVADLPRDVTSAAFEPVARIMSAVRTWLNTRWYQRMLRVGYAVQHGPRYSLRELGAASEYGQRFQQLDVERYFRGVSRRAVSGVLEILRTYGYDTAEFEQIVQNFNVVNGNQFNAPVSGSQTFVHNAK